MGVGSLDLNSFLIEGFTPDVDGVAGSTLIFFVDGGSGLILGVVSPPGAAGRSSPLMSCFNKFSTGPAAVDPSGSSVPW